ncbi:MAG: tyrosine-type recombinase/integrase, partial [Rhodobacterales bacterium]
ISMCLAIYAEEHAVHVAAPERIGYAIEALDAFWRDMPVSDIKGVTCRRYATHRAKSAGTVRRELGTLQASINHCHREGYLTAAPLVTLPPKTDPKERWLTRQEAAWMLRAARCLRVDGRHLADFILHGLYTGSRKATILAMHIDKPSITGGHVDTVNGVLYRRPQGKTETTKRQRPARLPARYLAHLRRQSANGRSYVVQDNKGRRVANIRKGWARAILLAMKMAAEKGIVLDLSDATPHVLKHTAITWALQRGASVWDAAGYFSTSVETIQRVYGHHSPDWQKSAVDAMDRR